MAHANVGHPALVRRVSRSDQARVNAPRCRFQLYGFLKNGAYGVVVRPAPCGGASSSSILDRHPGKNCIGVKRIGRSRAFSEGLGNTTALTLSCCGFSRSSLSSLPAFSSESSLPHRDFHRAGGTRARVSILNDIVPEFLFTWVKRSKRKQGQKVIASVERSLLFLQAFFLRLTSK